MISTQIRFIVLIMVASYFLPTLGSIATAEEAGASPTGSADAVPVFVTSFLEAPELKRSGVFSASYESVSQFAGFYIVPQDHMNSASHTLTTEKSVSGEKSHKAWIYAKNSKVENKNTNHRAYPTIQMRKTSLGIVKTAALVEFSVWADIDMFPTEGKNWFSLATFTSYDDKEWFRSYLINVDSNYKIHLMHVPVQRASNPDIFRDTNATLPRGKWSKITAYIDYGSSNRFNSPVIAVWMDGALVSASRFNDRVDPSGSRPGMQPKCLDNWDGKDLAEAESMCGLKYEGGLAQMHFGLYAPPLLTKGVIYNDALSVTKIIK